MKNLLKAFGFVAALTALQAAAVFGQDGTAGLVYTAINNNNEYTVKAGTAVTGAIVIPATMNNRPVTSISTSGFKNTKITAITLGSNITRIEKDAFSGCTNLGRINIPSGVTYIGVSAFENSGIASVTIPDTVDKIEMRAFYGCKNLTSVTIGRRVSNIPLSMFQNCTDLKTVTIPNGVTSISASAFNGCNNLTTVNIQASLTSLNFAKSSFPGDLRDKYLIPDERSGGKGTYTRSDGASKVWLKK